MCIIETRTYASTNGEERTYESIRRCSNAPPSQLCRNVERRTPKARIVETTPSNVSRSGRREDNVIITSGRDGRERVYRDLSRQLSQKEKVRRKSPLPSPSSPFASTSKRGMRPSAPSPPPSGSAYPPTSFRCPLIECPMMSGALGPNDDIPMFPDDNDFVHDIESSPRNLRRASYQSATDAFGNDIPEKPRHRKSVTIKVPPRPVNKARIVSPGLSQLPLSGHKRNDSGKAFPTQQDPLDHDLPFRRAERERERRRRDESAERARIAEEAAEQRRQADIEQARYRARETQRNDRANAAREESRERQRRALAASEAARRTAERAHRVLEADRERDDRINGELRALERERAEAAIRRSLERRYEPETDRERGNERPLVHEPRQLRRYPYGVPAIHNDDAVSMSRAVDPLYARGSDVIAREQARLTREELQPALGRMALGDRVEDDPIIDDDEDRGQWVEETFVSGDMTRRERMRRYKDDRRRRWDDDWEL